MSRLNKTHDARRESFIVAANARDAEFPIQNLPNGIFSTAGAALRAGVAIGDQLVDLAVLEGAGL